MKLQFTGNFMRINKQISLLIISIVALFTIVFCGKSKDEGTKMNKTVYDFKVKTIDGTEKSLSDYKGKVLLIVNVASYCGYTKHYTGLQELYKKYQSKGFEILAFPCNQFGAQEPGTAE
jgi:glutathione peroxidase